MSKYPCKACDRENEPDSFGLPIGPHTTPICDECGGPVFWCAVRDHWASWDVGGDDEIERDVSATFGVIERSSADAGACAECWCEIDALEAA